MATVTDLRNSADKLLRIHFERNVDITYDGTFDDLELWLSENPAVINRPNINNTLFPSSKMIYATSIEKYVLDTLNGTQADEWLTIAQQSQSLELICAATLRSLHPNGLSFFMSLTDFSALLTRSITIGWREEAEYLARVGFNDITGALNAGTGVIQPLPWFVAELVKDWLGAEDVDLTTEYRENEVGDLGPWQNLLDNWREAHVDKFERILNAAAETHIEQCHEQREEKAKDYRSQRFDIENPSYWVWPIELLAVLRLREWEGISNPILSHDLFKVSSLGQLHTPFERRSHPVLDASLARFSKAYPTVFTQSDLPRLRNSQGYRPIKH